MTTLHRTYSVTMDVELFTTGSDYEDCRSQMRDRLKHELNKVVYDQNYKTEITDEWEGEE